MRCSVCGTDMVRPIRDWYCPKEDDHPAERVPYWGPRGPDFRPLTDAEAAEQIRQLDPFQVGLTGGMLVYRTIRVNDNLIMWGKCAGGAAYYVGVRSPRHTDRRNFSSRADAQASFWGTVAAWSRGEVPA